MNNDIGSDLVSTAQHIADLLKQETNEEAMRILEVARTLVLSRKLENHEVQFARQMKQLVDAGVPQEYIDILFLKKELLFARVMALGKGETVVFCPVIPHKLLSFGEQRKLQPYKLHLQLEDALMALPENTQNLPEKEPYFCIGVSNFQFSRPLSMPDLRHEFGKERLAMVADEILAVYAHTNVFASQEKPPIMQVVATGYCKVGKLGKAPVFSIKMISPNSFPELQLVCQPLSMRFSPKECYAPICLARV